MTARQTAVVAGAVGIAAILEGCGGGGGPTPAPAPTPAPTAPYEPATPKTAKEMADWMNKQYLGFDATDPNSPLGLTISMTSQVDSFWSNVYCSSYDGKNPFVNPDIKQTGCSEGRTDCRFSASLYNQHMLVDSKTGATFLGLGRAVGILFNQTMVENYFGKCSYVWDGATDRKYNVGCGDGALSPDCDSPSSAYKNICPSTGKTCTDQDVEVKRGFCKQWGGENPIPETHGGHVQCAIPGVAIDYHLQDDWKPNPSNNHLRDMANARFRYNDGSDPEGPNIEKWNEVVIDEHLLIPEIMKDPAAAIPAIVYLKDSGGTNKANAIKARDDYVKGSGMKNGKIPIVGVDKTIIGAPGPFIVEPEGDEVEIV